MSEQLPHVYHQAVRNVGVALIGGWMALNAANYAQAAIERPTDEQVAALQANVTMDRSGPADQINAEIEQAAEIHETAIKDQAHHDDIERLLRVFGGLSVVGGIGMTGYAFWQRRHENEQPQVSVSQ